MGAGTPTDHQRSDGDAPMANESIRTPYGFVYVTTDITNGMMYIGKRNGLPNDPRNINYYGSGNIIRRIKRKLKKDGIPFSERFIRGTLQLCYSADELRSAEDDHIGRVRAHESDLYYNLRPGDLHNPHAAKTHAERNEIYKKRAAKQRGVRRGPHSPDHRRKIGEANRGKHSRPLSEEHKKKLSEVSRGKRRGPQMTKSRREMLSIMFPGEPLTKEHVILAMSIEKSQKLIMRIFSYVPGDVKRIRISAGLRGKAKSKEHRERISRAIRGRKVGPFTEEHKRRISEGRRRQNALRKLKIDSV